MANDVLAFLKAFSRHWVWWVGGSFISTVFATLQVVGWTTPAWLVYVWVSAGILIAMFLAWREQYQKVQELTKKAPIEVIDDLIAEGQELSEWLTGFVTGGSQKASDWIEKARQQLRANAPNCVAMLNEAVKHPTAKLLPESKGSRTIVEIAEWRSDKERHLAWQKIDSCVARLKQIRDEIYVMQRPLVVTVR